MEDTEWTNCKSNRPHSNRRHNCNLICVISFREANTDSGHFLVTSKLHARKFNCQREPGKKAKKYSTDKLKNAEISLQCK